MSTSEPTSTTIFHTSGECVVCGTPTSKCCSSCKKSGLDWMFFCSVEHQKLIWKVHKSVCGKNPFELPPLSDQEADQALNLRNSPIEPGVSETWIDYGTALNIEDYPELTHLVGEGMMRLGAEVMWKKILEKIKKPSKDPDEQQLLLDIRTLILGNKLNSIRFNIDSKHDRELLQLLVDHPFGLMSFQEFAHETEMPSDTKYSSDFQHRFLIFFAVVGNQVKATLEKGNTVGWKQNSLVQYTKRVILERYSTNLSRIDAAKAQYTVFRMIEEVLNVGQRVDSLSNIPMLHGNK
ncbi:hypothetical protein JCM5350_007166 [Sporobolomyces pararoseus]